MDWTQRLPLSVTSSCQFAPMRRFIDPLIIMLAVPLGLGGVLLILSVTGTHLSIQSLMGTLMMVGVVVNNSILLVEFANRRRSEGVSAHDAALSAASVRLRPILMTSLTLVVAMLPLSFQLTPGNEAMIPLARALLGGMVVSTALTLLLVGCALSQLKWGNIGELFASSTLGYILVTMQCSISATVLTPRLSLRGDMASRARGSARASRDGAKLRE